MTFVKGKFFSVVMLTTILGYKLIFLEVLGLEMTVDFGIWPKNKSGRWER